MRTGYIFLTFFGTLFPILGMATSFAFAATKEVIDLNNPADPVATCQRDLAPRHGPDSLKLEIQKLAASESPPGGFLISVRNPVAGLYRSIQWEGSPAVWRAFQQFVSIPQTKSQVMAVLSHYKRAECTSIYDHREEDIKGLQAQNTAIGNIGVISNKTVIYDKDIKPYDFELVHDSVTSGIKETREFRIHTSTSIIRLRKATVSATDAGFDEKEFAPLLAVLQRLAQKNIVIQKIEIIHTHPYEALLIKNKAGQKAAWISTTLSIGDVIAIHQVHEFFAKFGMNIPWEITAIVGLYPESLVKVSYQIPKSS